MSFLKPNSFPLSPLNFFLLKNFTCSWVDIVRQVISSIILLFVVGGIIEKLFFPANIGGVDIVLLITSPCFSYLWLHLFILNSCLLVIHVMCKLFPDIR